ncbi:MAG TPA: DUF2339 domain-containing protein [Roseimicrobium sp.]|nr:DUF2339 domain-containing protein [Roseimicrobium sp.]
MKRKEYTVTSQTLCATGVLILYAVTFACRSIYKFEWFGPIPAFLIMTLVTATAFLIAVRLNAMVVAILGLAGGFMTPILLSTGQDNPLGLFVYIALLDIGLLAVALRQRWNWLPLMGAIGTIVMQIGWLDKFFRTGKYFEGNLVLVAMAAFGGFALLYLLAMGWARCKGKESGQLTGSTLLLSAVALCVGFYFLDFPTLGERPLLIFSYLFIVDLGLLALAVMAPKAVFAQPVGGLALFVQLAVWNTKYLSNERLTAALILYFVLAVLHGLLPLVLQRRKTLCIPPSWCQSFAPLALLLALMPIFQLSELSMLIWPFVLLIDVLAIGLALLGASLIPVLAVLLLTLITAAAWILKIPSSMTGLPTSLFVIAGFAIFFLGAGLWLLKRFQKEGVVGAQNGPTEASNETLASQLPAFAVVLPFLLLILVTQKLPLIDPTPVFGIALLLSVLVLGVSRLMNLATLPAIGLAAVIALEHAWHFARFTPGQSTLALYWYVGFCALFSVFPFLFGKAMGRSLAPWIAGALSGPLHFFLIHKVATAAWPDSQIMGLLPALFCIPAFIGLIRLLKTLPADDEHRLDLLAWYGGVALFFITLIFPIQFDRQWITVGWALEGLALCWLYHRVPHSGLRLTGVALLCVAFARLALNPSVLVYHARAGTPILNWYLYAYGLVTVCLFAAAKLLSPPRDEVLGIKAPKLLVSLGTVLAFLLLNIEIADYFSTPGESRLTFQFSGNFARDMSYSIAWALFSLTLLIAGIRRKIAPARYASLVLLSVTLLKLFFHDLARLGPLYRIGALIAVGVVAMIASFLYQTFLAKEKASNESINNSPASK